MSCSSIRNSPNLLCQLPENTYEKIADYLSIPELAISSYLSKKCGFHTLCANEEPWKGRVIVQLGLKAEAMVKTYYKMSNKLVNIELDPEEETAVNSSRSWKDLYFRLSLKSVQLVTKTYNLSEYILVVRKGDFRGGLLHGQGVRSRELTNEEGGRSVTIERGTFENDQLHGHGQKQTGLVTQEGLFVCGVFQMPPQTPRA